MKTENKFFQSSWKKSMFGDYLNQNIITTPVKRVYF